MTPDLELLAAEIASQLANHSESERSRRLEELLSGHPDSVLLRTRILEIQRSQAEHTVVSSEGTSDSERDALKENGNQPSAVETVWTPGTNDGNTETLVRPAETRKVFQPDAPSGTRFEPLQKLGEGGQGEVWLALDPQLGRHVALKVVRSRLRGSRATQAKFQHEAEVTGKLEHPNIVPIYEAGTHHLDGSASSDATPFYVMRVYRDQSLHEAIKDFHTKPWSEPRLRELLSRFIDVCNAVGYAHSRGVIHRDLKPENVMLGEFGETLVVDWGLARVVGVDHEIYDEEDSPGTVQIDQNDDSADSSRIEGTPAFMAPEQARGEITLLTSATDIYGLGGILYCILTGQPPVKQSSTKATLVEVRAGRIPAPESIRPEVPRPLAAICMKALAMEPQDRYRKAEVPARSDEFTLAGDVTRWLNDEPLLSGVYSEPLAVRCRRWVRRHQTLATSTAAAILMAIVALSVLIIVVSGKNDELETARNEEAVQRQRAEALAKDAEAQRLVAEANAEEAQRQRLLADQSAGLAKQRAQEADAARLLAETNEQQALQAREEAESQRELADTNATRAKEQSQLALDTLNTVIFDVQRRLGSIDGTEEVRRTILMSALKGLEKLADEFTGEAAANRTTSVVFGELADLILDSGIEEGDQEIVGVDGDSPLEVALSLHRRALEIDERLMAAKPDDPEAVRDVSYTYARLGAITNRVGRMQEAREYFGKQLETAQRLNELVPDNLQYQRDLAIAYERLGDWDLENGNLAGARDWFTKELEMAQKRLDMNPEDREANRFISVVYNNLGEVYYEGDQYEEANQYYFKSLEISQAIANRYPNDIQAIRDVAIDFERIGNTAFEQQQFEEAQQWFEKELALAERMLEAEPRKPEIQRFISVVYNRLGDLALKNDDLDGAQRRFQQAHDLLEILARADRTDARAQRDLGVSYERLGSVELKRENYAAAIGLFEQELAIAEQRIDVDADHLEPRRFITVVYGKLAEAHAGMGNIDQAVGYYRSSIATHEGIVQALQDDDSKENLSIAYNELGDLLIENGRAEEALDAFRKAMEIDAALALKSEDSATAQKNLMVGVYKLGDAHRALFQYAEAAEQYRTALVVAQRMIDAGLGNDQTKSDLEALQARLQSVNDAAVATGPWDALQVVPMDRLPRLLYSRCLELSRQKRLDEAAQSADRLLDLGRQAPARPDGVADVFGPTLYRDALKYYAACGYALCVAAGAESDDIPSESVTAWSELAWTSLTEALDGGFNSVSLLRNDSDLNSLRGDPRFDRLVVRLLEQEVAASPDDPQTRRNLSFYYTQMGDSLLSEGKPREAIAALLKGLEIDREIAALLPEDADAQRDLMVSYFKLGRAHNESFDYAAAIEHFDAGVKVLDRMIEADLNAAQAESEKQSLEQRIARAEKARLATDDLDVVLGQPESRIGDLLYTRCLEFTRQQRLEDAAEAAAKLLELGRQAPRRPSSVAAVFGGDKSYRDGMLYLAASGYGLCVLASDKAQGDEPSPVVDRQRTAWVTLAMTSLKEAIEAGFDDFSFMQKDEDLAALRVLPEFSDLIPVPYFDLGEEAFEARDFQQATTHFTKAAEVARRRLIADPRDDDALRDLALAYERLGKIAFERGDVGTARNWYSQELDIAQKRIDLDESNTEAKRFISVVLNRVGDVEIESGNTQQGLETYRRSLDISLQLARDAATDSQAQRDLMYSYYKMGDAYRASFDYTRALSQYRAGIAVLDRMIEAGLNAEQSQSERKVLEDRERDALLASRSTVAWEALLKEPEHLQGDLLYRRCVERAKQGRPGDVEQAADRLVELARATALRPDDVPGPYKGDHPFRDGLLYYAACGYALAADKDDSTDATSNVGRRSVRRDELIARAITTLKDAIEAGFDDFDLMAGDSDLSVLRDQPGFKALLPETP